MTKQRKPKPKRDPYTEGVEAAHTNKMAADCPYSFSSPSGEQWLKGYEDGGGTE